MIIIIENINKILLRYNIVDKYCWGIILFILNNFVYSLKKLKLKLNVDLYLKDKRRTFDIYYIDIISNYLLYLYLPWHDTFSININN